MLKVYLASKLYHREYAIKLILAHPEICFTNRWQYMEGIPDEERYAKSFWQLDHADIVLADCVIVYAKCEDKLRGALVEAGIAIGLGKRVIVIGTHSDYGTWINHPSVRRVDTIEEAFIIGRAAL